MSAPLRLLLLNSTYPPHTLGGGPRIAGWIADGLRAQGHLVEILCAEGPGAENETGVHRILIPHGSWESGRRSGFLDRLRQCASYLHDLRRARRVFENFRPDAIIGMSLYNISHAAWIVAEDLGVSTIFFPVAAYSPEQLFTRWGRFERLVFPLLGWSQPRDPDPSRLGALAAPSRFLLDDYLSHGIQGRIQRVIPHGVPIDRYTPPKDFSRYEGPPWRILWLGRVTREKGYEVALDALAALRADGAPVRLSIVGHAHPSEEARLTDGIRARGIGDAVDRPATGLDDESAFISAYQSHHVFWLTSMLPEGLSLTMLEAMACGLPLVATTVGANTPVLSASGAAVGVPPGDAAAVAAATRHLLADPARRAEMGRAGRCFVEREHDLARMAGDFAELVTELARREGVRIS